MQEAAERVLSDSITSSLVLLIRGNLDFIILAEFLQNMELNLQNGRDVLPCNPPL